MENEKRLIDADELLLKIANATGTVDANTIVSMISHAPAVDAVEAVRCKDCRWYKKSEFFSEEDFCFYFRMSKLATTMTQMGSVPTKKRRT